MEKLDCKKLLSAYALSCIEDYYLYLISEKITDWALLFSESYLPFRQVIKLFKEGQDYSHFSGIPRIQKIGEKHGICKLDYFEYEQIPQHILRNKVAAIQISEKYMKDRYDRVLWREDHYILFKHSYGKIYEYLNNIPPDCGQMSECQIEEIYAGSIILFNMGIYNRTYKEIVNECHSHIVKQMGIMKDATKDEYADISLVQLRDSIGITKVLVKRMEAFMQLFDVTCNLTEYYEYLNKWYLKIEYLRLKNKREVEVKEIIKEIEHNDMIFSKLLFRNMNKIKEEMQ